MEIRPGTSQEEIDAKIEENAKLRLLEREYWNVVDGGVEELEVSEKRKGKGKKGAEKGETRKNKRSGTFV